MNRTVSAVLIIVAAIAGVFAYQYINAYTEEKAVETALDFLGESPTFSFDGMEDSVEVLEVRESRAPNTWEVEIGFTSRNGGYGDRSGEMVITVLTDHVSRIMVSEGEVIEAVTDDVFNELTGENVHQGYTELVMAKEVAMEFMLNAPTFSFDGVEGSMEIVDVAIAESFPVQYFISMEFECRHAGYGNRTGQVLAQVITQHEARAVVVQNEIRSAVVDGVWDEIDQEEL